LHRTSDTLGDLEGTRIDELYRRQAARRPDALAVICGDQQLTFGALATRTGALAARLRALGVMAERRVALVVARSLELAVGTLAIIEAGGVFVPIDPRVGPARIAGLAKAAGAELLLTQHALRLALGDPGTPVVAIEDALDHDARAATAVLPPDRPPHERSAADLLYVIHTSGSTAAPRPVEVEHASAVDQVQRLAGDLGVGPEDRHLHTASLGFTLAIRQLLLPICAGGAVVIARDDEFAHPLALVRAARRAEVTAPRSWWPTGGRSPAPPRA
jgi:non-ribosomal peptide synthetase component F